MIAPEKQDKRLLKALRREYPGIINLALEGAKQVIQNGYRYDLPPRSRAARQAYQAQNSSPLSFFESCCVRREAARNAKDSATVSKVYAVYQAWCKDNGLFGEPKRVFEEEIAAALDTTPEEMKVKKEHGRIFKDFTLTVETKEAYRRIYGVDYIVN